MLASKAKNAKLKEKSIHKIYPNMKHQTNVVKKNI